MAWLAVVAAGVLELVVVAGLRASNGFRRPLPTLAVMASAVTSFYLLSLAAAAGIPAATAYAVWTAIGAGGAVLLGAIAFREPLTRPRVTALVLLVAGVIGVRLSAG